MHRAFTQPSAKRIQQLRNEAGRWLRDLREQRGLSQRGLARKVGAKFTFISQIENGRCRIPPHRYMVWAQALEVDPREFVQGLLSFYEPVTYRVIFTSHAVPAMGEPHHERL